MSAASCLLSEDQFLCSICLDVFMNPVSTPCGHNFCKTCITQHWDISPLCRCPICKRQYKTRPELHVNTFISEMAAQFKLSAQQEASRSSSSSQQQSAKPGEVPCDVCSGTKLKALKSCLVCLASYCETHLEPHQTVSGLKRHQLIDPVMNLERRICLMHNKPLEMFCKTNQSCVCVICSLSNHKTHDVVPLKEEYEVKMAELVKKEAELQAMIVKRLNKIQEIKDAVQLSKDEADRELEGGVQFFGDLMEAVERGLKEFMEEITEKQRRAEKQAEDLIKELKQEIFELTKRSSEVEKLSRSEDHLHVIQNFSSVKDDPPTKDWTNTRVRPPPYEGMVVRAVSQVEKMLNDQMKILFEGELKRVQGYRCYVTLDPDMVHPRPLQHNRNDCRCVLSKQSFSSGRFYFELDVDKWSTWTLGVTREHNVKGEIKLSPNNGYWTLCLCSTGYVVSTEPRVSLSLRSKPEKVGVYVHYDKGLICFYDVSTAALICSSDCSFTEKLYPFFSPCANDGLSIHSSSCVIQ
ncbi:E3 ubiquitin/ISG15 ligase TRIM25-like [Archocentrus centrarchus]|uniref:E3 ubiquitin/ISG15 ligase TRIM25-like n=1 Tax=Archocentrus centrarchus TaxID=63155 RepID=UPI0011E9DF16|nr:E3 ubiquitin/ISG15 ligase TRIM25-like [Archocentrus centrarchus]XP_030586611.1 E3 ubiquitin/ISG15 ligase TRIM25-like [Archocentrus centrarchus]